MATMQEHEGRECENKLVMLLDAYDKFDFIKVLLKNQVRATPPPPVTPQHLASHSPRRAEPCRPPAAARRGVAAAPRAPAKRFLYSL